MYDFTNIRNGDLLLKQFNSRNDAAFGEVYYLFYNDLYNFTSNLYQNTPMTAKDVIQDVFLKLWESRSQSFETFKSLKGYLFICIKNKFKNYLDHTKSINKYSQIVKSNESSFISQVVETETLSIITQAINLLPAECAKVFQLHIEGWDVHDIAQQLDKSESTVYAQKQRAITILKSKLSKRTLLVVTEFIGII